jgi:aspartate/methionine/tyrosine aminotransferase
MTTPIARATSQRGRDWLALEQLHPIGDDVIDLSGDEIGGATTDRVQADTIAAIGQHLADHYTRRPGMLPLSQAVADLLAKDDVAVDVENGVIITGSVQEARFISLCAVATDKTVYLPRPLCVSDYTAATLFAHSQIEHFDPADSLPQSQESVVLLPNPNPATGQLYARETLERLARWAADCNLLVISDETLAPLCRSEFSITHLAALPGMVERTLTLGSFAGIPGLDAWLVSWIAGPKSLVAPARGLKLAITLCSAAASQHAALAGFLSGSERRVVQIPYTEPHTVAFIVADVSAFGGGDTVTAACARGGVQVTSGSAFGSPDCIRITAAGSRFEQGLERLNSVLTSLEKD